MMYVLPTAQRLPGALRRISAKCFVFVAVDDKAAEDQREMVYYLSNESTSVLEMT